MANLVLFINSFLSYLLVFIVISALIVVAVLIGIRLRKNKNNKLDLETKEEIQPEKQI